MNINLFRAKSKMSKWRDSGYSLKIFYSQGWFSLKLEQKGYFAKFLVQNIEFKTCGELIVCSSKIRNVKPDKKVHVNIIQEHPITSECKTWQKCLCKCSRASPLHDWIESWLFSSLNRLIRDSFRDHKGFQPNDKTLLKMASLFSPHLCKWKASLPSFLERCATLALRKARLDAFTQKGIQQPIYH